MMSLYLYWFPFTLLFLFRCRLRFWFRFLFPFPLLFRIPDSGFLLFQTHFSASFQTFCLTAHASLYTQKYGLFCSLYPLLGR